MPARPLPMLSPAKLVGVRVSVHRNLHLPGCAWSVRPVGQSRVAGHVSGRTLLMSEVEFRVRPSGRERARRDGQRNVHAFVVGTVVARAPRGSWRRATYDPFVDDGFVDRATRVLLTPEMACAVRFDAEGMWWLPAR